MVVVMQQGATEEQIDSVIGRLVELGFNVHRSTGVIHTVLGAVGGQEEVDLAVFQVMDGVKEAHRIASPYKLASRTFRPGGTVVKVGAVEIGGDAVVVMTGLGSAESVEAVTRAGARVVRGGANLRQAADRHGLLLLSEVTESAQIPAVSAYADILLVAARNMQNFALLRDLGSQRKPVLLERGIAATIEELLLSAEQILSGGNYDVILCERGIRTFETYTRNTMDISAIPVIKKLSHLPIVADPSRAIGRRDKVPPMALAAVAAGVDGVIVEVHPDPDRALSEGAQSLTPQQFETLMTQIRKVAQAVDRHV